MNDPFFSYDMTILPSVCDREIRLTPADTFAVFMDVATMHAEQLGVGAAAMIRRGLFWLTVKTKVRFFRRPKLMERITVRTCPLVPERYRSIREYAIEKDGRTLVLGKTEWAILETATGRLQRVDEVFSDGSRLNPEPIYPTPFARISPDFSDAATVGTYTVRSTDIDFGGHMNNVAYLRAMFGVLSSEELARFPQDEIEICFRTPCYEGNVLTFRRRDTEDGAELAALLPDGKPAVLFKAVRLPEA